MDGWMSGIAIGVEQKEMEARSCAMWFNGASSAHLFFFSM